MVYKSKETKLCSSLLKLYWACDDNPIGLLGNGLKR